MAKYPMDLRVVATVIATGDELFDEEIESNGGDIYTLTERLRKIFRLEIPKYLESGRISKVRTRSQDPLDLGKEKVEVIDTSDPKTQFSALMNKFVKMAYEHLDEVGFPPDITDEITALQMRQAKVNEFMASNELMTALQEADLSKLEPEMILALFTGESVESELVTESLDLLGLPETVQNALEGAGYTSIETLRITDHEKLLQVRGIGPGKLKVIAEAFSMYDALNQSEEPVNA
jgi:hypothetical protein